MSTAGKPEKEKELTAILYMATHMELMANETLGKQSETSKTILAAKLAVMREILMMQGDPTGSVRSIKEIQDQLDVEPDNGRTTTH